MRPCQHSGNKIHFTSLGCSRNLVDSEVMLGILLQSGYEPTEQVEEADYLVVNTCGFLEASREESLLTIQSLMEEKKKEAKLIVAGCMVQKHREVIKKKCPAVHYLLGSGDMEKILEAVESREPGERVSSAKSYLEWGEIPRKISTPKHFAYLKIAEGCMKQCSFCIIPKIKGFLRSKDPAQVQKEMRSLLLAGVKEIILIAQDLGDYGKERRTKNGLEELLKLLVNEEGDYWLRLLYLYPDEITEELIQLLKESPRICRYLDMPIQHINDVILKAMRRKTSKVQIKEILHTLRKEIPDIVIRTSLMVGFPGESEEQFEELLSFLQECPIDNVGIFKYSKEEESFSAKLPGHLSEEVKQERFERLAKMQQLVAEKQWQRFVGKKLRTLVDGYHPESKLLMQGHFWGQCPDIDGSIIINDGRKVKAFGEFYDVKVTAVSGYDLVGKVV